MQIRKEEVHQKMSLYGIKDSANLTLFDLATNKPELHSDYANVSTNEWTSERVYANAKGTRAIAWDHDKQSTLAVEMEVFELKWLAMLAGSEFVSGESDVAKREVLKATGNKLTLSGVPIAKSVHVVALAEDGVEHVGEVLEESDVAGVGKFVLTGSEVELPTGAVDGTEYAVYYVVLDSSTRKLVISADKFPKAYKVVTDALIRNKDTGTDEFIQITYVNARPQGNFTVTMSTSEPTNLSVTFDLFPNRDKEIATYVIID